MIVTGAWPEPGCGELWLLWLDFKVTVPTSQPSFGEVMKRLEKV